MVMVKTKGPTIKRTSLYGDLDRRFIAFLIDSTVLVFLHSLIVYFWVGLPEHLLEGQEFLNFQVRLLFNQIQDFSVLAGIVVFFAVVQWLYFALMESSRRQATFGKLAVGLKVTDLKGRPISFWRASGRYAAKLLSLLPLGGGFVMAFFSPRKQSLHDLVSKCLILQS